MIILVIDSRLIPPLIKFGSNIFRPIRVPKPNRLASGINFIKSIKLLARPFNTYEVNDQVPINANSYREAYSTPSIYGGLSLNSQNSYNRYPNPNRQSYNHFYWSHGNVQPPWNSAISRPPLVYVLAMNLCIRFCFEQLRE